MSLIGKKPFVQVILNSLSEEKISDLQLLVDNLGSPVEVSLVPTDADYLSDALKGVHYVSMKLNSFPGERIHGILCYVDANRCGLFSFQDSLEYMKAFKINPLTNTFDSLQEHLSADEFRRVIDDALESQAGGEVTPRKLASLMTADNGLSVDLTEAGEEKVAIRIDMSDAQPGNVLIANSDSSGVEWGTGGSAGGGGTPKYMHFISLETDGPNRVIIINEISTEMSDSDVANWLYTNGYNSSSKKYYSILSKEVNVNSTQFYAYDGLFAENSSQIRCQYYTITFAIENNAIKITKSLQTTNANLWGDKVIAL